MSLNNKELDKLSSHISKFGVDIDTKAWDVYKATIQNCERFGKVIDTQTEHGWHFRVYLPKEERPKDIFAMRYACGDDYHRLVRDMIKHFCYGVPYDKLDVLFDVKVVRNVSILKQFPLLANKNIKGDNA